MHSTAIVAFDDYRQIVQKSAVCQKYICMDDENLKKNLFAGETRPLYKQWKKSIIISNEEKINCFSMKRKVNVMQHKIRLRPDEVKDFVAAATKCIFDVDISYNRFIVDAKSILGVLGLNFNQVLTVFVNGYDEEFERYLKKFAVAC